MIPSFRAARSIADVLRGIGGEVERVYVVDDGCPEGSAEAALAAGDPRVAVLRNGRNRGVGAAMKLGYAAALADGAELIVKLDADGQMDPARIPLLLRPLVEGGADYAKGNRFAPEREMPEGSPAGALRAMPRRRRLANRLLSAVHRAVTGYWRISDPANGYTAIRADALRRLDLDRVADCYFFETDMLVALNRAGAAVADVPIPARYTGGASNLSLRRVAPRFLRLIVQRFAARLAGRVRRTAPLMSAVVAAAVLAALAGFAAARAGG